MRSSDEQLVRLLRLERLRTFRSWLLCLGVLALATALMTTRNTVGNPKTWSSAFNALSASGELIQYGVWLAGFGCVLLILGIGVAVVVARRERD
ncbi:hypothetical protein D3C72_2278380 [compost metagenome]